MPVQDGESLPPADPLPAPVFLPPQYPELPVDPPSEQ
jgi:hypothetical protein